MPQFVGHKDDEWIGGAVEREVPFQTRDQSLAAAKWIETRVYGEYMASHYGERRQFDSLRVRWVAHRDEDSFSTSLKKIPKRAVMGVRYMIF